MIDFYFDENFGRVFCGRGRKPPLGARRSLTPSEQPLVVERPVTADRRADQLAIPGNLGPMIRQAVATAVADHGRWQEIGRQITPPVCEEIRLALNLGCERGIEDARACL